MLDFLREQGVSQKLREELIYFRKHYAVDSDLRDRLQKPKFHYYGKEVWEMCIAALLQGEHLLVSGPKATGKNVLAENLAFAFGRPSWTVSFHSGTDSNTLIGTDTFSDNQVMLRKGSVYECAEHGGFGIFDEINMAKNDAIAVLHSALDHRRLIDIPGYEMIHLHEATRFIGTMNYGYSGTKEMNEALVSRFMVVNLPPLSSQKISWILKEEFPTMRENYVEEFAGLFLDLQLKSFHSEISTKSVDLRGLLGAIRSMRLGLAPRVALNMGIVGKSFDEFEQDLVRDVIHLRISPDITFLDIFYE